MRRGAPKSVSLLLAVQTSLTATGLKEYCFRAMGAWEVAPEPGALPLKFCFRWQHSISARRASPPFLGQHLSLSALEMLAVQVVAGRVPRWPRGGARAPSLPVVLAV